MKKIEVIYIPCYKRDFRLTRILVASIRHWYPDIPVILIKDEMMLKFDTSELEQTYNVTVYDNQNRLYGGGFSKLEILFHKEKKRILLLDSDIVMCGKVIDLLEQYDDDFIVHEEPFTNEDMHKWYFNLDKLQQYDPEFRFPGFTFNSGQLVATTGILKREDFDDLMEWTEPRRIRNREIFPFGTDQPMLNYVLMKKMNKGDISLRRLFYMRDGLHPDTASVSIDKIMNGDGYPFIIHWHDYKPKVNSPLMKKIPRSDLLRHFEDIYYRKAGISRAQQSWSIRKNYFADELFLAGIKMFSANSPVRKLLKKIKG